MQNQNFPLDLTCTFNIDNLPVGFGSLEGDGTVDRAKMANAIRQLAEIIGRKVAFGFGTERRIGSIAHMYTFVPKMRTMLQNQWLKEYAIRRE
jgi:hypothetical protein